MSSRTEQERMVFKILIWHTFYVSHQNRKVLLLVSAAYRMYLHAVEYNFGSMTNIIQKSAFRRNTSRFYFELLAFRHFIITYAFL